MDTPLEYTFLLLLILAVSLRRDNYNWRHSSNLNNWKVMPQKENIGQITYISNWMI
jgi:hypothetical protein